LHYSQVKQPAAVGKGAQEAKEGGERRRNSMKKNGPLGGEKEGEDSEGEKSEGLSMPHD